MLLLIVSTQDAPAGETASRFPTIARTDAAIAEASGRFAVPANWIRAVIAVESAGQASVVSPKGAMGLMQIMPGTWSDLRLRYHLGADPFDVHDNVLAGSAFLRELFDRFGPQGFLAAYNAGASRYLAYLTEGRPLPDETRLYLTRIAAQLDSAGIDQIVKAPAIVPDWRTAPVFAATSQIPGKSVWAGAQIGIPAANAPHLASVSAGISDAIPSRLTPQPGGLFAALAPVVTP
jgi:membrane-bound lytic murein transglycosylase B